MRRTLKIINGLVYMTGGLTILNYLQGVPNYLKYSFSNHQTLNKLKENYGKDWVVITGGTSGIGESFAHELSRLGYKILIVSRDQKKMDDTCQELKNKFNIQAKNVKFDFENAGSVPNVEQLKDNINSILKNERISILINNIGIQSEEGRFFKDLSSRIIIQNVNCNILSQMIMWHIFLNKLQQQKGRSLILDVSSSLSDLDYMPTNVIYQATKTFNTRFSLLMKRQLDTLEAIQKHNGNIDVALFKPGMVVSNLTQFHNKKLPISEYSDDVALSCLIDIANKNFVTRGTFKHKFYGWALSLLPEIARFNLGLKFNDIRTHARDSEVKH
jgi:short-subunit dehydrogenase